MFTPQRRARSRCQGFIGRKLAVILAVVGVLAFFAVGILIFGRAEGEEFSPNLFQRRTFSYFELPVLGKQISPINRDDITGDLEKHLVSDGILPTPSQTEATIWHLSRVSHGVSRHDGDPQLLLSYLDPSGDDHWLKWTKKNPQLAAILWPAVQELALDNQYVQIPELMTIVDGHSESDSATFRRHLNAKMAELYLNLARVQQKQGRFKKATETVELALKRAPAGSEFHKPLSALKDELSADAK